MSRIQKVSSYLLIIFNLLLIVLPLFSLSIWLFMEVEPIKGLLLSSPVNTPEGLVNLSTIKWTHLSKFIYLLSIFIGLLPLLLGLFVLKVVFQNYQKGEIFNAYNARHYRYLGWIFLLDAFIIEPLSHTLMVLAVTLSNPPGHRFITINFGSPNIEALFCGILVIVISWVMVEGYKLQEEQKLII